MEYYVYLVDGKVHEIIPAENPDLPGFPIEERYSAKFLAQCVVVSEDELPGFPNSPVEESGSIEFLAECVVSTEDRNPEQGDIFDSETGKFMSPEG